MTIKQHCLHFSTHIHTHTHTHTHTLQIPEQNLQLTLDCLRHTASLCRQYTAWSHHGSMGSQWENLFPWSCVTVNYKPLPGYDSAFAYSSTFSFVQMAAMLFKKTKRGFLAFLESMAEKRRRVKEEKGRMKEGLRRWDWYPVESLWLWMKWHSWIAAVDLPCCEEIPCQLCQPAEEQSQNNKTPVSWSELAC